MTLQRAKAAELFIDLLAVTPCQCVCNTHLMRFDGILNASETFEKREKKVKSIYPKYSKH